tara:strand:- start:134 stop:394 length:261 start_codon:yes stop_codon:yes gene_type:complete
MEQYFGGHRVSIHGFTEFDDPRGTGAKLTMSQIKDIEKKHKLVYGGHDELKQEAKKNKRYNEIKTEQKLEGIIDKNIKTLHRKYNS